MGGVGIEKSLWAGGVITADRFVGKNIILQDSNTFTAASYTFYSFAASGNASSPNIRCSLIADEVVLASEFYATSD